MLAELVLIAAICAQEAPPRDALPADERPVPATVAPSSLEAAAPAEDVENVPPRMQERRDELDRLFDALISGPSPSSWRGDAPPAPAPDAYHAKNATIIALRALARVTSDYIRICDVAEFVEDPEGLAPFLGTIVIGPAPELEKIAIIDREKTAQRIEEYGLTFDRYLLTGARQVLVVRIKAAHEEHGDPKDHEAPAASPAPDASEMPASAPAEAQHDAATED